MASGVLVVQGLREQRYKLRLRCIACPGERHHLVTLGMTPLSQAAVARRLRAMAGNLPFSCPECDGERAMIVAYFEAPHLLDLALHQ